MARLTKLPNNLVRGDTPLLSFPITINGEAADLSGYDITFTATTSDNPSESDTPAIQITVSGDSTGVADFQLLNDQSDNSTKDLVPGTTYYFDVQLWNTQTGTAKRVLTPVRGTFQVDADFTRMEA